MDNGSHNFQETPQNEQDNGSDKCRETPQN